jgi:hypothetical protein
MNKELPEFKLARGKGMHTSLFSYSCRMAEGGVCPDLVVEHLMNSGEVCDYKRTVPDREIEAAVEDAYDNILTSSNRKRIPPLSKYDSAKARGIYHEYGCSIADLESISPQVPPTDVREALTALYSEDDYICLGLDVNRFSTRLLAKWLQPRPRQLSDYQFIVPNPMSAEYGLKKNGKGMSARSYNNTGPRKFVVCDFDLPGAEMQPSLIAHLAEFCGAMPVLVLSSGNKSLHAWWRCDGLSDEDIRLFEDEAASVGADPAILGDARKNQLVRLPLGTRKDNQKKQAVLFWNPNQKQNQNQNQN